MQMESLTCLALAKIQKKMTELRSRYSKKADPSDVIWSIRFNDYNNIPSIAIQFDVLNHSRGGTYWGIDLTPSDSGWLMDGYLYKNRDDMVLSLDEIEIKQLCASPEEVLSAIDFLDKEFSRHV